MKEMTPNEIWKKAENDAKREGLERMLDNAIRHAGLPEPIKELQFHPIRGWRFDRAYLQSKLAIEVEGGVGTYVNKEGKRKGYARSRHTSGIGFTKDCEKRAEAAILGWRVISVTKDHIENGMAIDWISRALGT